jgi:hypothetical protein
MFVRGPQLIRITSFIILLLLPVPAFAAYSCGNDYNGDGDIDDAGEMADCVLATDGSNFCPLDSAECVIMTGDPSCPAGTTLNTTTNRCEVAPSCAQGTYNTTMNFCVLYSDAVCPSGATLNGQTDKCETTPTCEVGSYNAQQDMCVDMTERTCPANTVLNSTTGKCEAEPVCLQGTYNKTYNACVVTGAADPSCYEGLTLNTATDKCETAPNCYPGTFDGTSDLCIDSVSTSQATCPQGTEINLVRDVCEGQAKCPPNTVFNNSTKLCEASPTCGPGTGDYDANINLCKTPGSQELFTTAAIIYAAWTGWTCEKEYNPEKRDYCTPQLIYDETVWKINTILQQLEIGAYCPAGTAIDQSTLKCAQHPFCPDGTTLDIVTNTCIATPVCPQGLYDIFLDQCVIIYNDTFVPFCPAGTTELNTIADRCISPVQCPGGTMFNTATDRCETEIGCASGVYDTTRNFCVVEATLSCPDGTVFNQTTEKCEGPFSCPANSDYDATLKACSYGTTSYAPSCPSPGYYNAWFGTCTTVITLLQFAWYGCPSPYQFYFAAADLVACYTSPSCFGRGYLSGGTCIPYPAVTPTCPTGTSFNSTTLICEGSPICPPGSIYDPVIRSCSTVVNPVCVVGTTINTDRDLCEAGPTCVEGNSFNAGTDRCESLPQCPWGSFYDVDKDACVKNNGFTSPTCPKETFLNGFTDWCEGGMQCSPGATYNPSTKECEATPTCANGDLKYTTFDWALTAPGYQYAYCDIPASTTPSSCVANTTLDTDLDKCTALTECPTGTFFNHYTLWCEATPYCPPDAYYYPSLGICVATASTQPTCPSGARFNGTTDLCEQQPLCSDGRYDPAADICNINKILAVTCPWGTTPNGSTGKCEGAPQCEFGGIYDSKPGMCVRKTVASCTDGTSLNRSADLCQGSPSCQPNMGLYDTIVNQCVLATAAQCPTQGYLNRASDMCEAVPGCSNGSYDPSTGMCQSTGGITSPAECPAGAQLDGFYDKCAAAPTCAQGTYSFYFDKCTVAVSCSSGSYNALTDLCDLGGGMTAPPTCPSGTTFDGVMDACVSDPACLTGTTMDTGMDKCVVDPTCAPGAGLYDAGQNACVSYEKLCPLNTADKKYTCTDVEGVEKCSINTCFDPNNPLPPDSYNNLTDDGPVDPSTGQCLGTIYIFNGQSQRCLRPGVRTLTADCCAMPIPEDMYNEVSNPYTRFQRTVVDPLGLMSAETLQWLTDFLGIFQGGCSMNEMILNIDMQDKKTHYVGEWCLVKWVNWCVQKAQMHCRFNSTLARIINEQGRPQIKRFGPDGGWGTPEQPECSGFTFDEFQMLDFSRIDLSEFVDLVQERVIQTMQETMGETVSDFYDQTLTDFNAQ